MGLETATLIKIVLWISVAASVVSGVMSAQAAKKARSLASGSVEKARGVLHQVRATAMPRRLIFGTHRVGAIEAYLASGGTDNELLHYIFIWGEGPCKSVKQLMLAGEIIEMEELVPEQPGFGLVPVASSKYAGHIRMETNLGKPGENVHGQGIIPGWGAQDRLEGICYSWLEFKYSEEVFPKGINDVSAVIEGIDSIVDIRLGSDSSSDPQTAHSDNPALCLAYYLKLQKLGPGLADAEIGQDELVAAADACDDLVALMGNSAGYEKKYTFNGVISLTEETEQIIQQFLTSMAGWRAWVGGKFRMWAGAPQTPSFILEDKHLIGPVAKKLSTSRSDRFNVVRGIYVTEANKWQPTDFPAYRNQELLDADGEELIDDLELLNTNSPSMARRIAKIHCLRSRLDTVTTTCTIEAYRAQAGLPIYFNSPRNGFRMTQMDVVACDLIVENLEIKVMLHMVGLACEETADAGGQCDSGASSSCAMNFGGRVSVENIYDWNLHTNDGDADFDDFTPHPPIDPLTPPGELSPERTYPQLLLANNGEQGDIPASVQCRSVAGEKCMPNIPSFGGDDPLDPPRFFEKFERKSAAPFLKCNFTTSDCSVPSSACPGGISGSYNGTMPGIPFNIVFSFSVVKISEVPGVSGTFAFGGHCTVDDNSPNPPTVYGVRILCDQGGAGSSHNPGDVVTFPIGTVIGLNPQFFRGGYNTPPGMPPAPGCVDPGIPMVSITQDVWDLTEEWNYGTNSVVSTDLSGRNTYDIPGSCSPGDPPGEGTMPINSGPVSLYGGGVTVNGAGPTAKTYNGIECDGNGHKWTGSITDSLSQEVFPEDMIPIVLGYDSILDVPDGELDSNQGCSSLDQCCTAFILREAPEYRCIIFRAVKTRGYIEARFVGVGNHYEIKIVFGRRPVANGSFAIFLTHTYDIPSATSLQAAQGIFTEWEEVPNADGFETRAWASARLIIDPP